MINRKAARSRGIKVDYQGLGTMLLQRRKALGHSQADAAEVSMVSAPTFSRLETGAIGTGLDMETYAKACLYLGVSMESFIEGLPQQAVDTVTAIAEILRADGSLTHRGRAGLIKMIAAAYAVTKEVAQ